MRHANRSSILTSPRARSPRVRRAPRLMPAAALSILSFGASAQTLTLDLGQGGGVTERALQLVALVTVLALAPSVLVMVTSFTRIVVVLSLLRSAIGTQTAERRHRQPGAVPLRLRHGADLHGRLPRRHRAARRRADPAGRGVRARLGALSRLHVASCAREGSRAVRQPVAGRAAGRA